MARVNDTEISDEQITYNIPGCAPSHPLVSCNSTGYGSHAIAFAPIGAPQAWHAHVRYNFRTGSDYGVRLTIASITDRGDGSVRVELAHYSSGSCVHYADSPPWRMGATRVATIARAVDRDGDGALERLALSVDMARANGGQWVPIDTILSESGPDTLELKLVPAAAWNGPDYPNPPPAGYRRGSGRCSGALAPPGSTTFGVGCPDWCSYAVSELTG
jgi:hypothetical protein